MKRKTIEDRRAKTLPGFKSKYAIKQEKLRDSKNEPNETT